SDNNIIPFEIKIERFGPVSYKAHIDSPAGQAISTFKLPLTKPELETTLHEYRRNLRNTRTLPSGEPFVVTNSKILEPTEIGTKLFNSIFQADVLHLYHKNRRLAKQERCPLQIVFNIDPSVGELINLPWEFLCDTSGEGFHPQFLAFDQDTPIVRRWMASEPIDFTHDEALRVLLISANPRGSDPLNSHREYRFISQKLSELGAKYQIRVEQHYCPAATLADIKTIVRDPHRTPHIIHFVGHGSLGSLLMEDREGDQNVVSEQVLAIILKNATALRLVVLNACDTAQTDFLTQQIGVAQSLADAGIPAIVAMQFNISDEAALIFAEEFYQLLVEGHPIDSAVTWGRIAIRTEERDSETKEWATPTLYLQAPDGYLFSDLLGSNKQQTTKEQPDFKSSAQIDQITTSSQKSKSNQPPPITSDEKSISGYIRDFLIEGFTDQELRQLTYDANEFKPLYNSLSEGMGKDKIVHILIEYAERKELIARLLNISKEWNPEKYKKYQSYFENPRTFEPVEATSSKTEIMRQKDKEIKDKIEHLLKLRREHIKRLQVRELQKAQHGSNADPIVIIEINDLRQQIKETEIDIHNLDPAISFDDKKARSQTDTHPLDTERRTDSQEISLPSQAAKFFRQGQAACARENWGEAVSLLSRAQKLDPHIPDIEHQVIQARQHWQYTKEGEYKYLELEALYEKAQEHLNRQNLDGAASLYEAIVRVDAGYREAYDLALQKRAEADQEKAEKEKQQQLEQLYQQADTYYRKEEWAKAAEQFSRILEIDETYKNAAERREETAKKRDLEKFYHEGQGYYRKRDWAKAVAAFGNAAKIDESYEDVKDLLEQSRRENQLNAWINEAENYIDKGLFEAAIEVLEQNEVATTREDGAVALAYAHARRYLDKGDWTEAVPHLQKILNLRPTYRPDVNDLYQQATEAVELKRLTEKANQLIDQKEWSAAKVTLEDIVRRRPTAPDFQADLARVNEEIRWADLYKKAQAAIDLKQWAKAIPDLKQIPGYKNADVLLKQAQRQVELAAFYREGLEAAGTARWDKAVAAFKQVSQLSNNKYLEVQQQLEEAQNKLNLELSFNRGMVALQAGQAQYDLTQIDEAIHYLKKVVAIDPRYRGAKNKLQE
ncbi:MAG TPA: CHAT domain-containing protein, partial [Anaerolineae bacterium]|nr:CHAT domain-containing protein [Anaerolineae bacterium]